MPSPVAVSSGTRNRPSDCRAPIVTTRMAAADNTSGQNAVGRPAVEELVETMAAPYNGR